MEILNCKDLIVGYERKSVAGPLTFSVGEGDHVAVIGPNGSGKTTLVRTLLGLIAPISGSYEFAGGFRPGDIGYLPQQTARQSDFPASLEEVLSMGEKGFFSSVNADGVVQECSCSFHHLSVGQRQKVFLARALAAPRRILFLDEPVAALDPDASRELYETLSKLNKEGLPIVSVTHDICGALKYATHILDLGQSAFMPAKDFHHNGGCCIHGHH